MMILFGVGVGEDALGTRTVWLDRGDWLREISTAMNELTKIARTMQEVRSADGLGRRSRSWRFDSSVFVPNNRYPPVLCCVPGTGNPNISRRAWLTVEQSAVATTYPD